MIFLKRYKSEFFENKEDHDCSLVFDIKAFLAGSANIMIENE